MNLPNPSPRERSDKKTMRWGAALLIFSSVAIFVRLIIYIFISLGMQDRPASDIMQCIGLPLYLALIVLGLVYALTQNRGGGMAVSIIVLAALSSVWQTVPFLIQMIGLGTDLTLGSFISIASDFMLILSVFAFFIIGAIGCRMHRKPIS